MFLNAILISLQSISACAQNNNYLHKKNVASRTHSSWIKIVRVDSGIFFFKYFSGFSVQNKACIFEIVQIAFLSTFSPFFQRKNCGNDKKQSVFLNGGNATPNGMEKETKRIQIGTSPIVIHPLYAKAFTFNLCQLCE